jgi:hypothetical protein
VEIGYDPNTDCFIRAIDEGGMVWSGKTRYTNLVAALHDLEMGLGQILVDLTVWGQPSARSKHPETRSASKQPQAKRLPSDNRPSFSRRPDHFLRSHKRPSISS